jgi:nanoRNase/pAp phosphatase (c-di-AMP/oligoRNAs hydrolase)
MCCAVGLREARVATTPSGWRSNSKVQHMWNEVRNIIKSCDAFLITTHINPDGDAIGSEVAMKAFLENIDKDAFIVNSSRTPDNLSFLDPDREIKLYPDDVDKKILDDVDAVFILDVNNWEHVGTFRSVLQRDSLPRVCIDHHLNASEMVADVIVSDETYAATGMMVFDLIRSMDGEITRTISEALYTALIADTGTFRFSNTNARALRVAAELAERGANPFELHRRVFTNKTWGTGRLMGPVMNTLQSAFDGRVAWIMATLEMFQKAKATYDDSDGFVDVVRTISGVELALFFKEIPDGKIKVSLRSSGRVDAYEIANHLGGGGHRMAAGVKMDGPIDEAIETVLRACRELGTPRFFQD